MARVVYARRAVADLERLLDFLLESDPKVAVAALERIREAVSLLAGHPYLGRPIEEDLRELVISRGRTGYVALYELDEEEDVVIVLALRHQREAGFPG